LVLFDIFKNIKISWHYFAEYHGKSECDTHFSEITSAINEWTLRHGKVLLSKADIKTALDCVFRERNEQNSATNSIIDREEQRKQRVRAQSKGRMPKNNSRLLRAPRKKKEMLEWENVIISAEDPFLTSGNHQKATWAGDDIQCFYSFEVLGNKKLGCSVFTGIGLPEIKNIEIKKYTEPSKRKKTKKARRVSGGTVKEILTDAGITRIEKRILKIRQAICRTPQVDATDDAGSCFIDGEVPCNEDEPNTEPVVLSDTEEQSPAVPSAISRKRKKKFAKKTTE